MAKATSLDVVNRVSAASVKKHTGRDWNEWVRALDKAGGRNWSHRETVAFLKKKHKLTAWWQQGVAIGYQVAVGLRVEGQNAKGEYSASPTRTIPRDAKALWKFLLSEEGLAIWLKPLSDFQLKRGVAYEAEGGVFGEVRTFLTGTRMRLTWQEAEWEKPTVLQIYVLPRKGDKSVLVFMHDKIPNARIHAQLKQHWKSVLDGIVAACGGSGASGGD